MKTVINLSNVTDNSGELPIVTYSNPVTTQINDPSSRPIMPIIVPCPTCDDCCCNCNQGCNCCRCNGNNF